MHEAGHAVTERKRVKEAPDVQQALDRMIVMHIAIAHPRELITRKHKRPKAPKRSGPKRIPRHGRQKGRPLDTIADHSTSHGQDWLFVEISGRSTANRWTKADTNRIAGASLLIHGRSGLVRCVFLVSVCTSTTAVHTNVSYRRAVGKLLIPICPYCSSERVEKPSPGTGDLFEPLPVPSGPSPPRPLAGSLSRQFLSSSGMPPSAARPRIHRVSRCVVFASGPPTAPAPPVSSTKTPMLRPFEFTSQSEDNRWKLVGRAEVRAPLSRVHGPTQHKRGSFFEIELLLAEILCRLQLLCVFCTVIPFTPRGY